MKVIFLDHDGVICLLDNWGSRLNKQKKWGKRKLSMKNDEIPLEFRFDNFNKKAVQVLNKILDETGAEIVTSSDWKKWANITEMGEYYLLQGIIKTPIDFTQKFNYREWTDIGLIPPNFPWVRSQDLEQQRYFEILKWLQDNPNVTHWVSVDDLHMGKYVENSSFGPHERDWGLDNFVWTPRDTEGIKQVGIKEKIINYLI